MSAGPLSAVAWRGLALLALLGPDWGVGGLWVSGPRARSCPGVVGCRWSLRACATAPWASTLWLSRFPPSGPPLPFSGWRPRFSLRWFSWGVPCPGVLGCVWGPGLFTCLLQCLAGWGLLFPTHTINIYMEEPYEHKRAHTHRCTLKQFTLCKNRCSQTHNCLDLLLLQNLVCNISYVCCSITFNV